MRLRKPSTRSAFAGGILAALMSLCAMPAYGGPPATIPQHYSHIRIDMEQYSSRPMTAFDDQLLQNSLDLVQPDNSLLAHIQQVAPNTPQMIYSNVSSIYENHLSSWLNWADAHRVSREDAFYHAKVPIPFSGASPSATPVNYFWAVYNSGTTWLDMTWGASGVNGTTFSFATAGQATYIGYVEKFREINLNLASAGASWSGTLQYPTAVDNSGNPTSWATLTLDTDTTDSFAQSGQITFEPPANWVTATVNGSPLYYYVRIQTTPASGTAPTFKSLLGRDYVNANGGTSGTIPVFDYAADTSHDGYLNNSEYAVAQAAGDDARFVYESRVFCTGCGQMRFSGNVSNTNFRNWAVSFSQSLLAANPDATGIMMDNSVGMPNFDTTTVVEPTATYSADYASLLGAIDQAISPKWILPNVANPYEDSASLVVKATGAYSIEFILKPMADNYNGFLNVASAVSHFQRLTSPPPYGTLDSDPVGSTPTDPRMQIATLAEYYLLADPTYTFLDFYGGYDPSAPWSQRWVPATAYDVGHPQGTWSVFATGTDPSNPQATYYIYQRKYSNALVLYKPLSFQNWGIPTTIADNTATMHQLPGIYEPLNADGTLGAPESSVTLRNGEGAILIVTTLAAAGNTITTPMNTAVNGTLSGTGSGTLKFTLVTLPAHGTAIITNAAAGASNTATETITVTAPTPTATNGSLTAQENTAASGTLTASGSGALTFAIAGQPSHGTISLTNANTGAFTYTPATGYTGTDSFTFTASNSGGTSSAATENITVSAASGSSGGGSGGSGGSGNNGSSSSSSSSGKSGGGSFGWLGLGLLGALCIRRRRCSPILRYSVTTLGAYLRPTTLSHRQLKKPLYTVPGIAMCALMLAACGGGGSSAPSSSSGSKPPPATATLISIAVTPASPSVSTLTEQFTATGTYSDNSTQNLTAQANWVSSNTAVASISNASGAQGLATTASLGSTTISATMGSLSGNTTLSVIAAPMGLGRSPVTWSEAQSLNTPSYNGHNLLSANSPWFAALQQDISGLPADPNSDAMLARMVAAHGTINANGISGSYTPSTWNWLTMPINIVSGTVQPLSILGTWKYDPASNGPYLLPPAPVSIQGDTSTNYVTAWTDTADHHLLVLQRDETTGGPDKLWEYYQPTVTLDSAGNITAISGASYRVFDLKNGEDPAAGTPSTDAAGLPIMPLLLNYNEVASGAINHVLRGELNNSDIRPYYIWPARTNAGAWNPQGIPYGGILRLKQSWWDANADTVLGTNTQARVIGEAMLKYGIMVTDGTCCSDIELAGIADWRWSSDLQKRLDSIPVSAFEVVELQPTVMISGPSSLAVGEKGVWTFSFTNPGEPGPVIFNVFNYTNPSTPTIQAPRFVILAGPDQASITASDTFATPGTYQIVPYQRVYMNYNNTAFTITVQ